MGWAVLCVDRADLEMGWSWSGLFLDLFGHRLGTHGLGILWDGLGQTAGFSWHVLIIG